MSAHSVPALRTAIARQFLAFATVGAVGTGVCYVTLIVGVWLGLDAVIASGLGWSLGAVANYFLNYHLTFQSDLAHRHAAPRFATIAAIGLLLNTLLMEVQIGPLGLHYLVAQTVSTGAILGWNFVLSRIWAFKANTRGASARALMVDTRAVSPVLHYLRSAVTLWLGAALVVAGSAGFVVSVGGWRAARSAERTTFETQATVIGKATAVASSPSDTSTRYLALYRFTANDGTRFEGSKELPLETWERVAEGGPIAVRHASAEATDASAPPRVTQWVWPLLSGITGALAVLGVLLTRPGTRRLQAIWRVQHSGVDARAAVIDVAPIYTRHGRAAHWRIRYEFTDDVGRKHAGNSELMSPQEAARWSVDDGVAVRFDPHAPHHNCWLGTRMSRIDHPTE